MDCIPYINDLQIEIETLKDLKLSNTNIDDINKKINEKEILLEKCKNNLNKLSNNQIAYRIYLKTLNGLSVSNAIEEIADENYINDIKPYSVPTIWRIYRNLKKVIK